MFKNRYRNLSQQLLTASLKKKLLDKKTKLTTIQYFKGHKFRGETRGGDSAGGTERRRQVVLRQAAQKVLYRH